MAGSAWLRAEFLRRDAREIEKAAEVAYKHDYLKLDNDMYFFAKWLRQQAEEVVE